MNLKGALTILIIGGIITLLATPQAYAEAAEGGHCVMGAEGASTTWYFAEGYTGEHFQEYLCLLNTNGDNARAVITYMFQGGATQVQDIEIPSGHRVTVDVCAMVGGDKQVSCMIDSDRPVVAERPMYFIYNGAWSGGHTTPGATAPAPTWYFAEGYTGAGFDEYICVLNPGDITANLTFHFQTQEEGNKGVTGFSVPPRSRTSFKANDLLGGSFQNSLKLESDQPVVAERPMYFEYQGITGDRGWRGGHCVMGATELSTQYFFAEGTTRMGFETWLTIQNPSGTETLVVDATFYPGDGQGIPIETTYTVAPGSRYTVSLNRDVGEGKDVSARLTSSSQFLAERPMYFNYNGTSGVCSWQGGHCVIGSTAPASDWFFAEGYTGLGFEEWLCIQNPEDRDAEVEVIYYGYDARILIIESIAVPARTRITLMMNQYAGTDVELPCQLHVLAGPDIVAERSMYFTCHISDNAKYRWSKVYEPEEPKACSDIFALDSEHVWIAKEDGIYFYNGSNWEDQYNEFMIELSACDAMHCWGVAGQDIHFFDGSAWIRQYKDEAHSRDIFALDPSHVWSVGSEAGDDYQSYGVINFYDGQSWSRQAEVRRSLNGVFALDTNHVWAWSGDYIYFYDGNTWSEQDFGYQMMPGGGIHDLCATSPNHIWAVGTKINERGEYNHSIFFSDGTSWIEQYLCEAELHHITAADPEHIWAIGTTRSSGDAEYTIIYFYDGTYWYPQYKEDTFPSIWRISASDSYHVWATDLFGGIYFGTK
jgi:hypothetical protein